jgi:hypothetical protein
VGNTAIKLAHFVSKIESNLTEKNYSKSLVLRLIPVTIKYHPIRRIIPMDSRLFLHCGAQEVSLHELRHIDAPEETKTYKPVSHIDLVQKAFHAGEDLLRGGDYTFRYGHYGVSEDGNRMFGLLVYKVAGNDEMGLALGLRNSYDKSMAVGVIIGGQLFVCDNGAFSGDIKYLRKHTSTVHEDLDANLVTMIGESVGNFAQIQEDTQTLRQIPVDDDRAWELTGFLEGRGLLTAKNKKTLMREWTTPRHDAFSDRNAWSYYNCANQALKNTPIQHMAPTHIKMHHSLMGRLHQPVQAPIAPALPIAA